MIKSAIQVNTLHYIEVVQKPDFWGRPTLKPNPERAVEIPEQIILVQNLTAGLVR
jgi:hypothetical protein